MLKRLTWFGFRVSAPVIARADVGLAQFRDPQKLSLWHILILPFVGDAGRVPINRH